MSLFVKVYYKSKKSPPKILIYKDWEKITESNLEDRSLEAANKILETLGLHPVFWHSTNWGHESKLEKK